MILNLVSEYKVKPKDLKPCVPVMPQIDLMIPWVFFDGSSQGHPSIGGVGIVLYANHSHYFHIRDTLARGTNIKVEFVSLSMLLHFANMKGINKLQILGDSKVVID